MTTPQDSQQFDSYISTYGAIPESWDDARPFLVERFKEIVNSLNFKEIGWFLDQELLSGKAFIPSAINKTGTQGEFRSVLRYVVDVHPLVAGANTFPLPITFDANFTLIDLWVAATNSSTLTAQLITDKNVVLNGTPTNTIVITSPGAFDRAFCVIEYIQEL